MKLTTQGCYKQRLKSLQNFCYARDVWTNTPMPRSMPIKNEQIKKSGRTCRAWAGPNMVWTRACQQSTRPSPSAGQTGQLVGGPDLGNPGHSISLGMCK